jgi:MobA/MobL family
MFADQINAAIAATAEPRALDMLARSIWQAHGSGALDDAGASAALEALQCRRSATRPQTPPPSKRAPRASARRQRSPDRQASIERRRRLAASGPMPPAMAANFTGGELSALRIVGDEVRVHGCCALHLDAIAARAGTCRTTVKNALRQARALGLVTIHEVLLTTRAIVGDHFGDKCRAWDRADQLVLWREHWAETVNLALEREGIEARIDHRSLAAQGLESRVLLRERSRRPAEGGHTPVQARRGSRKCQRASRS